MLRFFPFKSKQFTALLVSTKYKRYISLLQTVQKDNCYKIHHKIHREEKELNRILPAIIFWYGKYWYKNGKIHRDEKDENGRVLPAIIYNYGTQSCYKNGKLYSKTIKQNNKQYKFS